MLDVAVIGAGLTGLTIARHLAENSMLKWALLDKSRAVGGRLATRRIDDSTFDHGAQFFTVRSSDFRQRVDAWINEGIVREWCRGFQRPGSIVHKDGFPRYAAVGGMNRLPKYLAKTLPHENIALNQKLVDLTFQQDHWAIKAESGTTWLAQHVVLTMPAPQARDLLLKMPQSEGASDILLTLNAVQYDPCVAVLGKFAFSQAGGLPRPFQSTDGPLAFVADNALKGVSANAGDITIHLGSETSRTLFDNTDASIVDFAIHALRTELPEIDWQTPLFSQVHRWRYAKPSSILSEKFLAWTPAAENFRRNDLSPTVFFAGEGFGGPNIEGAFLSGMALGRALLRCLRPSEFELHQVDL